MCNLANVSQIVQNHFEKLSKEEFDYLTYRYTDEDNYSLDECDADNIYAPIIQQMNACRYEFGATKLVIFFNDLPDYIVKIPFQGSCQSYYDYDECKYAVDSSMLVPVDELCGAGLEGIITQDNPWDYCETEAKVYELAQENEIEDCFAGTFYLNDYYGYPIYVSEKIQETWYQGDGDKTTPKIHQSEKQAQDLSDKIRVDFYDLNMIAILIEQYGYDKVNELMHFICNYDIRDLHSDNLGFDANGELKLIDYSGFND